MPWAEVPDFVAALRATTGVAAQALEFTILTAARSGEVLGATWAEIDLDAAVWTIPATRMKSQREHRVPLAPAALNLLRSLYHEEGNPFLFINGNGGGLAPKSMRRVLGQMGKETSVHGFRSSFRDWAGERTNFPREVAEAALAHRVGDAVEQAYGRGDALEKRRRLMEAWSEFCASPAKVGGDVVSIKQKAN